MGLPEGVRDEVVAVVGGQAQAVLERLIHGSEFTILIRAPNQTHFALSNCHSKDLSDEVGAAAGRKDSKVLVKVYG